MCGPQAEAASSEVAAVVESTRPTQAVASRVFLRGNGTVVVALANGNSIYVPSDADRQPWFNGVIGADELASLGHVELTAGVGKVGPVAIADAGDLIVPGFSSLSPDNQSTVIESFLRSRGLTDEDASLVMNLVHGVQAESEHVLREVNQQTGGRVARLGNPFDTLSLIITLLGAAYAGTPMLQKERDAAAAVGGYVN